MATYESYEMFDGVGQRQVQLAQVHATVHEFWYVVERNSEIWRDNYINSCITILVRDISLEANVRISFQ